MEQQDTIKPTKRMAPGKFLMLMAIGSMFMAFAGLTSAYVVRYNQAGWTSFKLPFEFTLSTIVILISSVTLYLAIKAFKQRRISLYKGLVLATVFLGSLFIVLQVIGYYKYNNMLSVTSNVSTSFVYAIGLLHALHVIGGAIALFVIFLRTFNRNVQYYSSTSIETAAIFWHFVDFLWLYLFIFFTVVN
jgi:cytochrome c oxidase subunit III